MEVSGERVTGGSAPGDRRARPKWHVNPSDGDYEDFESFFKTFFKRLLNNQGSFKVDGSLLFEFVPKAHMRSERLISAETSFAFHRMEEGVVYNDLKQKKEETNDNNPAIESYNYQKNVPPLDVMTMEEFMPMI